MPELKIHLPQARKDASEPPPQIPGHQLLRCIGRGSYGEVWLARDAAGVYRAVKVVYRKTFEQDRPFEREFSGIQRFEPISRTHSSQVGILQVGRNQDAGYFYYVMELADDEKTGPQIDPVTYVPKTIKSELTRRGRLPFQECLEISLCLTTALDHLHKHGLIHRDIKPSNIIFVNGVPKLADIGLVTDVGATISYVGTEGFLPPEGPVSLQADIYSLGKVLYEISTGRDRLDFPELPTFLDASTEKEHLLELNLVFLKACQNNPRKRYHSAKEMYAELALLQSGKSLRRARAMEKRLTHLTRLAAAGALAVAIAGGAYHFVNQRRLHRMQQDVAVEKEATRRAESKAQHILQRLVNVYQANGHRLVDQGDWFGALLWFAHAAKGDEPDEARQAEHRKRMEALLQQCPKVPAVLAHSGPVNCAAFSPDGRRVLTASEDRTARVWDAHTGEATGPPLPHKSSVLWADWANGEQVATASADGAVQVWQSASGEALGPALPHAAPVRRVQFSPGGRLLFTVSDESLARVWDVASGRLRFSLPHKDRIRDGVFSPDGRWVATGSDDGTAMIWDADTGHAIINALRHPGPVTLISFSPDSRRLLTVSGQETRAWNAATGEPARWTMRHDGAVQAVAFSPDARLILTAGEDATARLWDAVTGRLAREPLRHTEPVTQALFSPDGQQVVTVSSARVQVWDAFRGEPIQPVFLHNARALRAEFSRAGERIVTASADGTARVLEDWPSAARTSSPATPEGSSDTNAASPISPRAGPAAKPAQFVTLAQYLSGREIDPDDHIVPLKPGILADLRKTLVPLFPTEFPAPDLVPWHFREAELAEARQRWFAAAFHWGCALALRPSEAAIARRHRQALAELNRSESAATEASPALAQRIPPRPSTATANLIDLSAYYNAALVETWLPTNVIATGNDLSELPTGVQKFNGVEFDVRGLIQLSGSALENLGARFPQQVSGIALDRRCSRLHFLHGTGWDALQRTQIGGYRVHFANGEVREVNLIYGENVRDWWFRPTQPGLTLGAAIAWQGANPAARGLGMAVRVYQITWKNPLPDTPIQHIDFFSSMTKSAPFLVAITVE